MEVSQTKQRRIRYNALDERTERALLFADE